MDEKAAGRATVLAGSSAGVGVRPAGVFPVGAEVPVVWVAGDVLVGLYEVRGSLGVGGMARVYRVRHRGWGVDLAVKSPLPQVLAVGGVQGFTAEAGTWVDLGLHPHIVTCYYVRTLGGVPRVFAELVDGGSLKDWIDDGRLYAGEPAAVVARLLDVAVQFAWGLAYAHEQGLVHQDVKPANVLLTEGGVAKVTDFGLARGRVVDVSDTGPTGGSTVVRGVGGTPGYFSPEQAEAVAQARAGAPVGERTWLTRRTDVWSWAVSVLEMFAGGRRSEHGQAAVAELEAYLASGPLGDIPAMPDGLVDLLGECLSAEPDRRPHDFHQIAERLAGIHREATGADCPRRRPEPVELLADQLNNKALSLLDLEHDEDAERLFEEALAADPHHPEATYNRGLRAWRRGDISDLDLIAAIEAIRISHEITTTEERLLGLVHLERGDRASAIRVLEAVDPLAADPGAETERLLAAAREGLGREPPIPDSLQGHTNEVSSVAVTDDGRWAISGSADHTVRVWDLHSGICAHVLEGHTGPVAAVAVTGDGKWVVSTSTDPTARLHVRQWDRGSGQCTAELAGDSEGWAVAVTADGQRILTAGYSIDEWDMASREVIRTLGNGPLGIRALAISAGGRWAVAGGGGADAGTVSVWDLESGNLVHRLHGHSSGVSSVAISRDGRWIVSGSQDEARVWDRESGECLRALPTRLSDPSIQSNEIPVTISPDGRWIVSSGSLLRVWDRESGVCLHTFEPSRPTNCVAFAEEGRLVVAGTGSYGGGKGTVEIRRFLEGPRAPFALVQPRPSEEVARYGARYRAGLATVSAALSRGSHREAAAVMEEMRRLPGYQRKPELVALSHQLGRHGRRSGLAGAWHRRSLTGHDREISSIAIDPLGRWAVSGSWDSTAIVWDLKSGESVQTLPGHAMSVDAVAMAPTGRYVASGSRDGTIRIWDTESGTCMRTLEGHTGWVTAVAVSPDGRWIVSGSWDQTVRLWDVDSGECLHLLDAHTLYVNAVAVAPDGRVVVSASSDRTVRVWDVRSGECRHVLQGHSEGVQAVAVSPDGRTIVSGGLDQTLRMWDLDSGDCARTIEDVGPVSSLALTPDGRFAVSGCRDRAVRIWDLDSGDRVRMLSGPARRVSCVAVSPDGRWLLDGSEVELRLWELDWRYELPDPVDWDEAARAYLEIFLTLHTPYTPSTFLRRRPQLSRRGIPAWSEGAFQQLLTELEWRGYGWLRPEGVRARLEALATERGWRPEA